MCMNNRPFILCQKSKRKENLIIYSLSCKGPSFTAPRSSGRFLHLTPHQNVTDLFRTGSFPIHTNVVSPPMHVCYYLRWRPPQFSLCNFDTDDEAGYWCKIPVLKGLCEWG